MVKAAVIGCGRIASGFDDDPKRKMISTHIGAYQHVKGIDVVAICDRDNNLLNDVCRKWGIKRGYTDYLEMLRKEQVDIVSVCTPPSTHAPIVIDIAKHKLAKAIFCEKPMAASLKEAKVMIEACHRNKIILQIDHQRRFDQLHQAIRDKIQSKVWGRVQRANFYYSAGIRNTGSHMFDLLRFFFGDARWVQAYPSANVSHQNNDPNLDGFIQFKDGLLATFQALDHKNYMIFELDCYFEGARIIIQHSGLDAQFYKVEASKFFSGYKALLQAALPFKKDYKRSFMVNAVKEMMNSLKEGRPSLSSGQDGLGAMELIEMSLASAKAQGKRMLIRGY
jgi:predicted dehydrogenase